jgi:hypothetical protein
MTSVEHRHAVRGSLVFFLWFSEVADKSSSVVIAHDSTRRLEL